MLMLALRAVQVVCARARVTPSGHWATPHPVDPNRARFHELLAVPGLGPRRAEAILIERIRGGPYHGPDSLVRVDGIGPSTAARLARFWGWPEHGR